MARKQNTNIILRVSKQLKRAVTAAAKKADLSASEYIRVKIAKSLGVAVDAHSVSAAKKAPKKSRRAVRRAPRVSRPASRPTPNERPLVPQAPTEPPSAESGAPVDVSVEALQAIPIH